MGEFENLQEQLVSGMVDCMAMFETQQQGDDYWHAVDDEDKPLDKEADITGTTASSSFVSWLSFQDCDGYIVMPFQEADAEVPLKNAKHQESNHGDSNPFTDWLSSKELFSSCGGCSDVITQLTVLLDTTHCDGDFQDEHHEESSGIYREYQDDICAVKALKQRNDNCDEGDVMDSSNESLHATSLNNENENTDQDEEECVLSDEINLHTVTPQGKKKLSEMLLETSLFQPTNHHSWGNGWSLDAGDVSTVDLESLDAALNNHQDIFREQAPPSPSQVHLLGASASSTSSGHDSIFEREEKSKTIPRHIRPCASPVVKSNTNNNELHKPSSNIVKNSEHKSGKENTIIVMRVNSRKGKQKYARHARKQRLAAGRNTVSP